MLFASCFLGIAVSGWFSLELLDNGVDRRTGFPLDDDLRVGGSGVKKEESGELSGVSSISMLGIVAMACVVRFRDADFARCLAYDSSQWRTHCSWERCIP